MAKIIIVKQPGTVDQLKFLCPGCKIPHTVNTTWTFNGDLEKPTLDPSVRERGHDPKIGHYDCHSYITRGKIKFLNDCSHELAGQQVDLPEITA